MKKDQIANNTHTPEPWFTKGDGLIYAPNPEFDSTDLQSHKDVLVADVSPDRGDLTMDDKANADRIVGCINGCKGIQNPAETVPELVTTLKGLMEASPRNKQLADLLRRAGA